MNASPSPAQSQYDNLIEALGRDGQEWTIRRLENYRHEFKKRFLTLDEIHDAFGNPEDNEKKADALIDALSAANFQ
jgi:hypothetical protein